MLSVMIILTGITGCSNKTEKETKAVGDSTQTVKATENREIFDGKKENRSFMIGAVLHKADENYIETYDFEKEGSKNVLYLKGNFTVTGTMDGEVSTVKEAKLEISEECVFYDNRAEYQEKNDMNLKEFKEHISSDNFQKAMHMDITVDNGLVWLVELGS